MVQKTGALTGVFLMVRLKLLNVFGFYDGM